MAACHQHEHHQRGNSTITGKNFIIAIVANGGFVVIQLIFSYIAHSTSLFADAVHNLGDVFSLMVAWAGNSLLLRKPTVRTTYGMKKASILAALTNVIVLVFTCGIIATEAMYKFFSPIPIDTADVMMVASVGIVVNALTALLFWRKGNDINIRATFLHLVYDALVSLGVVLSAALLAKTGWLWLDPLVGLLIAGIILKGTWSLLVDSGRLILDGVPRHISVSEVQTLLENEPGVESIHDLHIWALSTQENAMSVHLWMPKEQLSDKARHALSVKLLEKHNIHHITIQVEQIKGHCEDTCVPYLL